MNREERRGEERRGDKMRGDKMRLRARGEEAHVPQHLLRTIVPE